MTSIIPSSHYRETGSNVLVIGSGTSGLAVALELAALGADDIVVAEQGPFAGFEHQTVSPPVSLPESAGNWQGESDDGQGVDHYGVPPGAINSVGGRSRCWYGVVLRVDSGLLCGRWPGAVASRLLGTGPGSYAQTLRELEAWRGESLTAPQSANDLAVIDVLARRWPGTLLAVPPQAGRSSFSADRRGWSVYSPLLAWRGEGLARHRDLRLPVIVHDLQALALVTEGGRVTGVRFRTPDGPRTLMAGHVVIAAGTLESTRLYGQAVAGAGSYGRVWPGLHDHLPHGFVAPLPPALREAYRGVERTFIWADLEASLGGNLFIDVHRSGFPEPVFDAWWLAAQEEPHGDVVILDDGEDGLAAARVRSGLTARDLDSIAAREDVLRDLFRALSADDLAPGPRIEQYPAIDQALATRKTACYWNPLGTAEHEAGTIALGAHLGPGGRAPWAENLFVAGPPSFPPYGAANPTLTILALARQTAEALIGVPAPPQQGCG